MDVTSDVICPWRFIGERQMEKATANLSGMIDVQVRWHPFQLNPQMPAGGLDRKEYRTAKFGSWERSQALDAQVAEAGRSVGIPFDFDQMARTPNTLDAHPLIALAGNMGIQDEVVEAFFRVYFIKGHDISDTITLLDVASEAGLDRNRSEALLAVVEGLAEIQEANQLARRGGVRGFPYSVINDELAIPGVAETLACLRAFGWCVTMP